MIENLSDDDLSIITLTEDDVSCPTSPIQPAEPSNAGPRSRSWCFTINNYSNDDYAAVQRLATDDEGVTYLVVGKEKGEQGTPHLQGYVHFSNPRRRSTLRAAVGNKGHWEKAKGTAKQNRTYCTKEGEFWEHGVLPSQGKRSDINVLVERLCNAPRSTSVKRLVERREFDALSTYAKYPKFMDRIRMEALPRRVPAPDTCSDAPFKPPQVFWLHGPTGCGKSRWAYETYPEAYRFPGAGFWYDGYVDEEVIIFDDFRFTKDYGLSFNHLLTLLDPYPLKVPIKGGMVEMLATTFIFTCPTTPECTFMECGERVNQLLRRITEVRRMGDEAPLPTLAN